METFGKSTLEIPTKKCANVGRAEKMIHYLVLQQNIIPAYKYSEEKGSTSDPHYEMALQKCADLVDFEKIFMQQIECLVAKIGFDTAENEPSKVGRFLI